MSQSNDARTSDKEKAIIATGSAPVIPPVFAIKDPRVMDSTGALDLPDDVLEKIYHKNAEHLFSLFHQDSAANRVKGAH